MTAEGTRPEGSAGFTFTPQEALEFMQKMWNPLGLPLGILGGSMAQPAVPNVMPFGNPGAMFAALDPAEVERKIAELKVIENWLSMSLNMMQMSVKTLELQKASLEAMRSAHAPAKPDARSKKGDDR
jgi:hypothetical protein